MKKEDMSGYRFTKKLKEARLTNEICAGAQALFHELVDQNNNFKWADTFWCKHLTICAALNITVNTLKAYRNQLVSARLIACEPGPHKGKASVYSLNDEFITGSLGIKNCYQSDESYQNSDALGIKNSHINSEIIDTHIKEETININLNSSSFNQSSARVIEFTPANQDPSKQPEPKQEKEKSSAKKEKEVPTVAEADNYFKKNYYRLYESISMHNENARTEQQRYLLLDIFWQENVDDFERSMPEMKDVLTHFRNWVPKYTAVKKSQQLTQNIRTHATVTSINRNDRIADCNAGANAAAQRIAARLSGAVNQ